MSEISSLGVDAVILDSVEFPESIYLDKAVFSGEEKSIESRNAVLHSFIEKVKNVLGDKPLCVMLAPRTRSAETPPAMTALSLTVPPILWLWTSENRRRETALLTEKKHIPPKPPMKKLWLRTVYRS